MQLGLQGKVVMVTGGAGRIGPVICHTFAREGALIGVLDIPRIGRRQRQLSCARRAVRQSGWGRMSHGRRTSMPRCKP